MGLEDNRPEPRYAVWLTEEEVHRIMDIQQESERLMSIRSKIRASAYAKGPRDPINIRLKEEDA